MHQSLEIVVEHFFFRVRESLELNEDAFHLVFARLVAELLEPFLQRVTTAVLSEDESVGRKPDVLRFHDLVCRSMLDDAVLVNACLMRERVLPDDRLVALHDQPRRLAK